MIRLLLAGLFALTLSVPARALDIQQVTSEGGIKAWLVEAHDIPFTALRISFKGGASLEAPNKRGEINLMTATLEEGAGDMSAQDFAAAEEGLAANFGFDVGDDTLTISAQMLSENRDQAVDLLRQALINPRFDQSAVDRVRGQVQAIIASNAQDPNALASKTFAHEAFGDHPYGSSINGTAESVAALTREDMFDAKSRVMAKDRMVVSAVGDITAAQLGPMLDHLLGDLPAKGADIPAQNRCK